MDLKFTQEIKDAWLTALKSGDYIQGVGMLKTPSGKHCCLGVLAEIHPELSIVGNIKEVLDACTYDGRLVDGSEYGVFDHLFGYLNRANLTEENDDNPDGKYTAVIPLIEALPVVEP